MTAPAIPHHGRHRRRTHDLPSILSFLPPYSISIPVPLDHTPLSPFFSSAILPLPLLSSDLLALYPPLSRFHPETLLSIPGSFVTSTSYPSELIDHFDHSPTLSSSSLWHIIHDFSLPCRLSSFTHLKTTHPSPHAFLHSIIPSFSYTSSRHHLHLSALLSRSLSDSIHNTDYLEPLRSFLDPFSIPNILPHLSSTSLLIPRHPVLSSPIPPDSSLSLRAPLLVIPHACLNNTTHPRYVPCGLILPLPSDLSNTSTPPDPRATVTSISRSIRRTHTRSPSTPVPLFLPRPLSSRPSPKPRPPRSLTPLWTSQLNSHLPSLSFFLYLLSLSLSDSINDALAPLSHLTSSRAPLPDPPTLRIPRRTTLRLSFHDLRDTPTILSTLPSPRYPQHIRISAAVASWSHSTFSLNSILSYILSPIPPAHDVHPRGVLRTRLSFLRSPSRVHHLRSVPLPPIPTDDPVLSPHASVLSDPSTPSPFLRSIRFLRPFLLPSTPLPVLSHLRAASTILAAFHRIAFHPGNPPWVSHIQTPSGEPQ